MIWRRFGIVAFYGRHQCEQRVLRAGTILEELVKAQSLSVGPNVFLYCAVVESLGKMAFALFERFHPCTDMRFVVLYCVTTKDDGCEFMLLGSGQGVNRGVRLVLQAYFGPCFTDLFSKTFAFWNLIITTFLVVDAVIFRAILV